MVVARKRDYRLKNQKSLSNLRVLAEINRAKESYVRASDGVKLYTRLFRQKTAKQVPLILCDGLGCEGYAWKYIIPHFASEHPIIHWNYRGHGRSEVPPSLDSIRVPSLVEDLQSVLQHYGISEAILCGHSMGVQILLEAFPALKSLVKGYVFICCTSGFPMRTWHMGFNEKRPHTVMNHLCDRYFFSVMSSIKNLHPRYFPVWKHVMKSRLFYAITARTEVNGRRIKGDDFRSYLHHVGDMDPRVFAQAALSLSVHTGAHILPQIDVPTLIFGGKRDTFAPGWVSKRVHKQIKNSDFLMIEEGTHAAPIEYPELICQRMEQFFRDRKLVNVI